MARTTVKKSSRDVARELKKIYERDGPSDRLQSDQDLEFHGRVGIICKKYKIRRIRSRPYYPQSQGKVERSHRRLRDKMMYDLLAMKGKGVNWAKTCRATAESSTKKRKKNLAG